jgi:hypothetical protein
VRSAPGLDQERPIAPEGWGVIPDECAVISTRGSSQSCVQPRTPTVDAMSTLTVISVGRSSEKLP